MDPKLKVAEALLGQGMAQKAGQDFRTYPEYQRYAIEAQTKGLQPLPPTDPNWQLHMQQMMSGG